MFHSEMVQDTGQLLDAAIAHLQSTSALGGLGSELFILTKLTYKSGLSLKREKLLHGMKKVGLKYWFPCHQYCWKGLDKDF